LREIAAAVVIDNQAGCTDIDLTSDNADSSTTSDISDPSIPALNHWGLLLLSLAIMLIAGRLR
jgi:hypothetical protein